ncbi:MAG TPA: hypothetical protein VKZ88_01975, partial [Fibrobacteria bacterium]|nr:hypothetical protein [Fibrobacteria bacterium]
EAGTAAAFTGFAMATAADVGEHDGTAIDHEGAGTHGRGGVFAVATITDTRGKDQGSGKREAESLGVSGFERKSHDVLLVVVKNGTGAKYPKKTAIIHP